MPRHRLMVFQLSSDHQTSQNVFGHWIRAFLILVFVTFLLFLIFTIGWLILLFMALASVPFLIRTWLSSWKLRHRSVPEMEASGSRTLDGEWKQIEEHSIKDDESRP